MNDYAYNEGFRRGVDGARSSDDLIEAIFGLHFLDSEETTRDREEGYKAGLLARAIRDGDDD